MRVLLIQARHADDPMLAHELECFIEQCDLPAEAFRTMNLTVPGWAPDDPWLLDDVDVVMFGGSGDFSLAKGGFDWHESVLALVRRIVASRTPMFASCFGFQAIVQAFGGTVETAEECSEVGTFEIRLTQDGQSDPLFSGCGTVFNAQLGHNDSARLPLPENLVWLAFSERAPVQAVRVKGYPVVATQFHPELSMDANMVRYMRYQANYSPHLAVDAAMKQCESIHAPSPEANALMRRFLDLLQRES